MNCTNNGNYPTDFYNPLPDGFTKDKGVKNFFEEILGITPVNGSIQFANGTVTLSNDKFSCDNNPDCAPK